MANTPLGRLMFRLRQLAGDAEAGQLQDRQLLQRFVTSSDESAFEVLLERHGPLVWGLCLRLLRHRQDAEDAFQATFLVLARNARCIRKHDSLASWLYGVAYRIALRARSRAAQRLARERQAVPPRGEGDPLDALSGRELCSLLDDELTRLPERYRGPLVLCCLEGRTRDEAARQLGMTLSTLKRRLERGRELLQTRLARRGLSLATALPTSLLATGIARATPVPSLIAATRQGAVLLAAGKAASGVVSTQSLVLASAALRTLVVTRLKNWTLLLLLVAGLATGTSVALQAGVGEQSPKYDTMHNSSAVVLRPPTEARICCVTDTACDQVAQEKPRDKPAECLCRDAQAPLPQVEVAENEEECVRVVFVIVTINPRCKVHGCHVGRTFFVFPRPGEVPPA